VSVAGIEHLVEPRTLSGAASRVAAAVDRHVRVGAVRDAGKA
jgi:hypothetical protein